MKFLRTDPHSRTGLIVLLLMALLFAPFVSASTLVGGFSEQSFFAENERMVKCDKMMTAKMAASQQADASCCQQGTDCQSHCQNLLLSHLPVSVFAEMLVVPLLAVRSVQLSSSQILKGIIPPQDPRPPQV